MVLENGGYSRVGDLDKENKALRDEMGSMEQYSRRNCLAVHGVPE